MKNFLKTKLIILTFGKVLIAVGICIKSHQIFITGFEENIYVFLTWFVIVCTESAIFW